MAHGCEQVSCSLNSVLGEGVISNMKKSIWFFLAALTAGFGLELNCDGHLTKHSRGLVGFECQTTLEQPTTVKLCCLKDGGDVAIFTVSKDSLAARPARFHRAAMSSELILRAGMFKFRLSDLKAENRFLIERSSEGALCIHRLGTGANHCL